MAAAFLPTEISYKILERLPLKSIARFKCVSKDWCNLLTALELLTVVTSVSITDSSCYFLRRQSLKLRVYKGWQFDFIYSYLSRLNITNNNSINHLLYFSNSTNSYVYFPDFNPLDAHQSRYYFSLELPPLFRHGDYCYNFGTKIVGYCNGLFCFCTNAFSYNSNLVLCNPVTGDYRILPCLDDHTVNHRDMVAFGFGYDPKNKDYKLVKVINYPGVPDSDLEAFLYSLRAKAWKSIHVKQVYFPFEVMIFEGDAVFYNNLLHWVVRGNTNEEYGIGTFDLADEKFGYMALPNNCEKAFQQCKLRVLDGFLCLKKWENEPDIRCEMWMMKEYGKVESWSQLFSTIDYKKIDNSIGIEVDDVNQPIDYYPTKEKGDFLVFKSIHQGDTLLRYGLKRSTTATINLPTSMAKFSTPIVFTGSPVQILDSSSWEEKEEASTSVLFV